MMYDSIPPRHVAAAIANLGADRVRAAWRYLDQWAALERAGVPRATLRDATRTPVETGPLTVLSEWARAGSRGLLVLCGAPGTGKTYAAARWTVLRHLEGRPTTWISAAALSVLDDRERRARINAVADRSALVIDDVGAGATHGDWLRDQLQGLLQHRLDGLGPAGMVPTLVCSNGTVEQISAWAGPRVTDRAKLAGGFAELASRESLRGPLQGVDALGRDRVWYRAHRLVDVLGVDEVERYDEDGRRRVDLDVGRRLDVAARREGYGPCEAAEALLELTRPAVEVEARRLADVEVSMARAVAGQFGVELGARLLSLEGVAAAMAGQMAAKARAERERVQAEIAAVTQRARRAEDVVDPVAVRRPPTWAMGKDGRKALRRLGFGVVEVGDRWQTRRRIGKAEQILATGSTSEAEAWDIAARLCAEVDTLGVEV
jgi:hypothetical protein